MQQYSSLETPSLLASWVAVGVFDGVHRGHQALLSHLTAGAHAAGLPAAVVTFHPHPAVALGKVQPPFYLTSPQQRAEQLSLLGIDALVTLAFNASLAQVEAEAFMRQLIHALGLRRLVVGEGFALGRGRQGNILTLQKLGEALGYGVEIIPPQQSANEVISSSRARALLAQGDMPQVAALLGRPYRIAGPVVHGDGRGRTLGIPTANIAPWPEQLLPPAGVYATWFTLKNQRYPSVTNVGYRPTFLEQAPSPRVETLVLDFERDIYGDDVELDFITRLRPEQRFPGPAELIAQIQRDIQHARETLSHVS